jgi:hypothetical protein
LGFSIPFSKFFLKVGHLSVEPNLVMRYGSVLAVTLTTDAA